jgi:hypothetical protein
MFEDNPEFIIALHVYLRSNGLACRLMKTPNQNSFLQSSDFDRHEKCCAYRCFVSLIEFQNARRCAHRFLCGASLSTTASLDDQWPFLLPIIFDELTTLDSSMEPFSLNIER